MRLDQDWQGFLRSLATYTRIPLNIEWGSPKKHTPSVCFLPWVGVVVALISAWPLLMSDWSAAFQAIVMMLSAVLLTGAFHEDGLMDACDGLVGGWTPEQRLSIMKDSRVGSYGVLAGLFSFALKWWLLSQWLTQANWHADIGAVLMGWISVHVGARWLPLAIMASLNYVNQGDSKARAMISPFTVRGVLWVVLSMLCVALMVGGAMFVSMLFTLVLCFIACLVYLRRRIQGYNGDTLGASEQIAELLLLFTLLGGQA
ncbi:adenosylcobinamide-GDP ribazoletransferase [Marinomonas gallaica]|uniref:adenosylcobinamide-GDP ribazoletransferase n=1 Tax=Marinomonas gallaica TaxID=1806667 RepID=UPI00082DAE9F|nr:adenosylcobinamide-GDP ribazoletransferase [Marinomonas gallaica]